MKQFTLKSLLLVLTILMGGVNAWGEEFSATYSYGSFKGWELTNYDDATSYYIIPSGDEPSVATILGIFTEKTITSNVVVTLNVATYGNGTNPDASTFSIYNSSSCTEEISATQGGTLPTSKTYTNVTYTIDQQNVSSFTSDLAIKIVKPGRQIRLKSIKVEFSYSAEGEVDEVAPTIDAQPISAIYFQNDDADALSVEVTAYPAPSYQWYSNTSDSNEGGTLLSGETNSTYTPSTTEIGTSYYYCVVTNSAGTVTSEVASVVVNPIFEGTKLEMSASQDAQIKFVKGAANDENSTVWNLASPNPSNGITLSGKVTSGNNYSYFDGSVVRFYTNNEIIITPSAGVTIGKIEIVRNTSTSSNTGTINCSGLTASKNNTTTNTNVFTGLTTNPITFTASAQARFTAIYVYYISNAVPVPTFSLSSGNIYGTQTLELTTTVEDGTILYTTDETDPTTSETALMYKNPIEISETTTIKACVKVAEKFSEVAERKYTFIPSIANTKEKAYTTAEAIALIDNTSAEQLAAEKVYVKGVVSKVDSYNSTYKSITYWLDNDAFEVYSGKDLDCADFSAETDIEVGATVIVYGNVKKYKTTYEFDKENYLVSYTAPERASLPATDGTANYATFSSDRDVEFVDATVYAVNVVNGVLQLNEVASKQVPAGTGVLLQSEKETAPYFYINKAATIDNNLLKPASLKPASLAMSGSYTFYKLAYDDYDAKTGLGFYWGADKGGTFTVKAGTAYLAVPNAVSVKGFLLDGTPTAIEGVEAENNTDVIYNLSGQRVQKAQRGLYIVNGKKLMVK